MLLSSLHGEQTGSVKDQEGRTIDGKLALIITRYFSTARYSVHEGGTMLDNQPIRTLGMLSSPMSLTQTLPISLDIATRPHRTGRRQIYSDFCVTTRQTVSVLPK